MSIFRRSRIRRTRRGTYRVDLPEEERDLLRRLLPQLRSLLADDDAGDERTRRLHPPAYADDADADADADYQRLMREDLVASRLAALDAVEGSVDATELEEQQLLAWLGSVNNLRLVLGTVLDVSEELEIGELPEETPDIEAYALYAYLSSLLGEIVDALDPGLIGSATTLSAMLSVPIAPSVPKTSETDASRTRARIRTGSGPVRERLAGADPPR